jgi:hypothetical protein
MEKYPIAMTAIKKTGLREPPGSNLAVREIIFPTLNNAGSAHSKKITSCRSLNCTKDSAIFFGKRRNLSILLMTFVWAFRRQFTP